MFLCDVHDVLGCKCIISLARKLKKKFKGDLNIQSVMGGLSNEEVSVCLSFCDEK